MDYKTQTSPSTYFRCQNLIGDGTDMCSNDSDSLSLFHSISRLLDNISIFEEGIQTQNTEEVSSSLVQISRVLAQNHCEQMVQNMIQRNFHMMLIDAFSIPIDEIKLSLLKCVASIFKLDFTDYIDFFFNNGIAPKIIELGSNPIFSFDVLRAITYQVNRFPIGAIQSIPIVDIIQRVSNITQYLIVTRFYNSIVKTYHAVPNLPEFLNFLGESSKNSDWSKQYAIFTIVILEIYIIILNNIKGNQDLTGSVFSTLDISKLCYFLTQAWFDKPSIPTKAYLLCTKRIKFGPVDLSHPMIRRLIIAAKRDVKKAGGGQKREAFHFLWTVAKKFPSSVLLEILTDVNLVSMAQNVIEIWEPKDQFHAMAILDMLLNAALETHNISVLASKLRKSNLEEILTNFESEEERVASFAESLLEKSNHLFRSLEVDQQMRIKSDEEPDNDDYF